MVEGASQIRADEPVPRPPKRRPFLDSLRGGRGIALLVASIVLLAALSAVVVLAPEPEKVCIAVVLPYEEEPFSHATEITSAMQMAVDELNKWGGIGNVRIELVIEASIPSPSAAVSVFEAIERDHDPLAYVTVSCGMMAALSPLAEAAEVPLLGMASAPGITEGYEWVYRYYTTADSEVQSAMRIIDSLNVTTLGILYTTSPHGCGIHDLLSAEFASEDRVVTSEPCPVQEVDYSAEISNLSSSEAIYLVSSCEGLVAMVSAVAESGYSGYVLTASCGSSPEMYGMFELDEVYVSAPALYKVENLLALDFAEKYRSVTSAPLTHHGATAYDIVYLLHGLLEGHELSSAVLGYQLDQGFVFSGIMGSMRIDPGDHDFEFPVYPAIVSEGELSYL